MGNSQLQSAAESRPLLTPGSDPSTPMKPPPLSVDVTLSRAAKVLGCPKANWLEGSPHSHVHKEGVQGSNRSLFFTPLRKGTNGTLEGAKVMPLCLLVASFGVRSASER